MNERKLDPLTGALLVDIEPQEHLSAFLGIGNIDQVETQFLYQRFSDIKRFLRRLGPLAHESSLILLKNKERTCCQARSKK